MPDTWPGLLKFLLDSPRVWAVSFAVAFLGLFTFAARRYGRIDDLSPAYYYPVVGLGFACGVFIAATAVQNIVVHAGASWAAYRKKKRWHKQREEFARRNFPIAGDNERSVLLYYKRLNRDRFRVVGDAYAQYFRGMERQALLDLDTLDGAGGDITHFRIPPVVWKLLDDPPPGWDDVGQLGDAPWEYRERDRI